MPRIIWMAFATVAAFLAILLARLPTAWALAFIPSSAEIQCVEPSGTLWAGRCGGVATRGASLGTLEWRLNARSLLRGRLAGTASAHPAGGLLETRFEVPLFGRSVDVRELRMDLPLDPELAPWLPPALRARVSAQLRRLHFDGRRIDALAGRLVVHDLREGDSPSRTLGSYELEFEQPAPVSGPLRGVLRDAGGPLAVQGTVTLTDGPGYLIEGRVAARPEASAELARSVAILGSPDGAGGRPFSLSGTF